VGAKGDLYGADGRREPYGERSSHFTRPAKATALVALAREWDGSPQLDWDADPVRLPTEPAHEAHGLCEDARFAQQPVLQMRWTGSAVLVAPDVVAMAGHSVHYFQGDHDGCEDLRFVFGYGYGEAGAGDPTRIDGADVYACKRIIARRWTGNSHEDGPLLRFRRSQDYALVQLDRPVSGRRPVELGEPVEPGDEVAALGHPLGLPLKLAPGGRVLRTDSPHLFTATLDTLRGNSGGPVVDAEGRWVGHVVAGHASLEQDPSGCKRAAGATACDDPNRCGVQVMQAAPMRELVHAVRRDTLSVREIVRGEMRPSDSEPTDATLGHGAAVHVDRAGGPLLAITVHARLRGESDEGVRVSLLRDGTAYPLRVENLLDGRLAALQSVPALVGEPAGGTWRVEVTGARADEVALEGYRLTRVTKTR
jgi:hypothetical protein